MSEKKNVTESVTKTKNSTSQQNTVSNDGFCVYLGPSITGVIQNGTVYCGTKAKVLTKLETVIKKYPLVSSLIVPDKTLSEDRIKVKTPGNILYVNYKKLMSGMN